MSGDVEHPAAPYMDEPQAGPIHNLTDDEHANVLARADEVRAAYAAERAAAEPFRRAALALGPALRDLEAAVACLCGCHPSAPQPSLHGGGTSCPCQWTDDEHDAAAQELHDYLDSLADDPWPSLAEQLAEPAAELGVELRDLVTGAPFVISGLVDGVGFYLRERHGAWQLVVAGEDDQAADVWKSSSTDRRVYIASGVEADFYVDNTFSPERALRIAVDGVRLYVLRRACDHPGAQAFCPLCGAVAATTA